MHKIKDLSRRMLRILLRFSDTNLSKIWIVSFSNVSSLQDKNAFSVIGKGSDFIFDSISAPLVQKSSFSLIFILHVYAKGGIPSKLCIAVCNSFKSSS